MGLLFQGEDILKMDPFCTDKYWDALDLEPPEVRDWTETGLELTWEHGGVREQPDSPNLLVYHWTGGEGDAERVFKVLRGRETRDGRGLSVQLFIDYQGVVWQYCDLDTICRHAGMVNGRSIGVEMQNRAFPRKDKKLEARLDKRYPRGRFQWKMNGRKVTILGFTTEQLVAVQSLTTVLCDAFEIPMFIPGDESKVDAASEADTNGFVLTDRMPPHAWSTFRGVCGHYHVHRKGRKLDPGPQVFEALWDTGEFDLQYMNDL